MGPLGSALANQVVLGNVAARAWTDFEGQKKTLHIEICFRSTAVNNKNQKSNCLRLKSGMLGIEKNEHIIFETKNTQFKFKTNSRSKSGPNMKFWLKEKSNYDTINYYTFLNQLSKEDNLLIGAMCKKVADMSWLRATVKKAVNTSNQVNATIFKQFEIEGYRDINKIANRCFSVVEKRSGKIQFVKVKSGPKKNKGKCRYSKKVIFNMQDTLKDLRLYNSKIDGK